MKLFGHPIHTMLVHFPTALLPMDWVLSIIYYKTGNSTFGAAALYCLIGGVLSGFAAMMTGLIDIASISKEQKIAIGNGLIHGFTNATVVLIFCVFAYSAWQQYPKIILPSITVLIIKSLLILTLFTGNYLGGRLIFKHHIGIDLKQPDNGRTYS